MRAASPALIEAAGAFAVTGAFCGAAVFDFAAARTSVSVTRPSGPVPFTLERSIPSSAAMRRATGDAFTRASSSCGGPPEADVGCARDTPVSTVFSFFSFCGSAFSCFFSALASFGFSSSFFCSFGFASSFGVFSPSSPMNAILSPTFTLPPSST